MARVFAYCRVSTADQSTKNQALEIKAAGFKVESRRLIDENISGSVAATERPGHRQAVWPASVVGPSGAQGRAETIECRCFRCRSCPGVQYIQADHSAGAGRGWHYLRAFLTDF